MIYESFDIKLNTITLVSLLNDSHTKKTFRFYDILLLFSIIKEFLIYYENQFWIIKIYSFIEMFSIYQSYSGGFRKRKKKTVTKNFLTAAFLQNLYKTIGKSDVKYKSPQWLHQWY